MVEICRRILQVFADNGLFDEGVALIGSWCFLLYQKHLGAAAFPLRTQDIDFLIPSPFHGKEHAGFIGQLEELGFQTDFKRDGSLYLWNAELKIEFITVEKGRGTDEAVKIKKLGVSAIPLRHVGMLFDKTLIINAEGIRIRVPTPESFCLHKLVIASRRKMTDKCLKDLQQAICTSTIVNRDEIKKLFRSLPKKWCATILRMLEKAESEFPLYAGEIGKLKIALQ